MISAFVILAWGIVFYQSILSAVNVWWVSEIYSHGFFILPIAGYLIWLKRKKLSIAIPEPGYWAIPPLLLSALIYIVGVAGDINLFQHTGVFSILPLTVWLVFGTSIAKIILFPLLFILFSIPFGEEFIPVLQQITADISVWMLQGIGIPIFRNGLYIEVPNGKFIVAEACSGVRFFVGSAVFGAIYAYISYRNRRRQLTFFGIALVVPIIANSIRVSAIILIGYYSDMKYATGADHIVYGWVFFSIVIILLVIIGNIWADKPSAKNAAPADTTNRVNQSIPSSRSVAMMIVIAIALYMGVFTWSKYIINTKQAFIELAATNTNKLESVQDEYWQPKFEGATETKYQVYSLENDQPVDYFSAYYQFNTPKSELISSRNRIYDPDDWTLKQKNTSRIFIGNSHIDTLIYYLAGSNQEYRIIMYWYEIGNQKTHKKLLVKLYQSVEALLGRPGSARVRILSTKYKEEEGEAILINLNNLAVDKLSQ